MEDYVIVSANYKEKLPENKRLGHVWLEGQRLDTPTTREQLINLIEKHPENVFVKIDREKHKVYLIDSISAEKVVRCIASIPYGDGDDLGNVSGGIYSKDFEKIALIDLYVLELIRDGKINERVVSSAQCIADSSYGYIEVHKSGIWSITEAGLNQLDKLDRENPLKRYDPKTNSVVDAD